jgi:hypothetical protein
MYSPSLLPRMAVQVVEALVLGAVDPGFPGLAAVTGVEDQVVGADDEAFALIGEPDVEERPRRSFAGGTLGLAAQGFADGRSGGRRQLPHVREHEGVGAAAVQLHLPGRTAITVCRTTPS